MMRAQSDGRRLYKRGGSFVLCFKGVYFGPKAKVESQFDGEAEVTVEELKPVGGKKRIKVIQGNQSEVWTPKELQFVPRGSKASKAA